MQPKQLGRLRNSILVIAIAMLGAIVVRAQGVASLSGRVSDSSGAAIADAQVTAKNLETGESRTTTTEENGSYRVLSLPVGKYELKVEKDGFKTQVTSGIDLVVGQEGVFNVALEVGTLAQEVTVTSEAPVVNTTTAPTSGLVNEQEVKDLPLNGRSYDNLITLNAGTANFTGMKNSGNPGALFSISGRRIDQNLFLLNGVEWGGNNGQQNSPNSVSGQLLGIDAVREFNVLTDNYSAEYGKRAGGQVLVVTMGGTNQLHGSAFEFLRNSALDARNFFDQQPASLGTRIPHFERNNFGGSLGGPIRKDKTFIFGNFEGLRQLLGLTNVADVPDLASRAAAVPGVAPYLALWPLPNGAEVGGGVALYLSSPRSTISEEYGTARVDQIFSSKDSVNAAYTIDNGTSLTPQAVPFYQANLYLRTQLLSLSEVHIFSPNVLNTATVGFNRASVISSTPSTVSFPASLSFVQGYPGYTAEITVGSGAGGSQSTALTAVGGVFPAVDARNLFTETDSMQVTRGRHLLSFGVWFQQIQDNDNQGQSGGKVNFTTLANFLAGIKQSWQGTPFGTPMSFRSFEGAWFVEDTIRLRSNLTLSAGLRHEFTDGWHEANGRISEYQFVNGILQSQPVIGSSQFSPNYAKKLFAPRLGLAWDVFGNGKTAVHAGAGMYYNLLDDVSFWAAHTPPFNAQLADTTTTFPFTQITQTNPPPSVLVAPAEAVPNVKTPTVVAYDLKVEQQLSGNLAFSLGYSGSHMYHGLVQEDLNGNIPTICGSTPGNCPASLANGTYYYPPTAVRFNPAFSSAKSVNSVGLASYNGLIAELVQHTKYGLTFKTNYTWSRSLDSGSEFGFANATSTVLDIYDNHLDWAPSAWNVANRFSFTGSYDLPIGKGKAFWSNPGGFADRLISNWKLNTIVTVQSGFPVNLLLGKNQSNNGNVNNPDRPSFSASYTGQDIYSGTSIGCATLKPGTPVGTPSLWYDPCVFTSPFLGTYGNVARNYLKGPDLRQVDLSLFKDIQIVERVKMEFRAEAFNISNHTNFGAPNGSVLASAAGQITSTATTSRQLQFGLKMIW